MMWIESRTGNTTKACDNDRDGGVGDSYADRSDTITPTQHSAEMIMLLLIMSIDCYREVISGHYLLSLLTI